MSNPQRFFRIFLLNEAIIFIPFLIILGALYFDHRPTKQQDFFNSWSFIIAIIIFTYFQICTLILTVLHYFNIQRRWICLLSLLFALILATNQIGFYYFDFQDLLQRLIETSVYAAIIIAFQILFQLLSELLCQRFKLM